MLGCAQLPIRHIFHNLSQVYDECITLWYHPSPRILLVAYLETVVVECTQERQH